MDVKTTRRQNSPGKPDPINAEPSRLLKPEVSRNVLVGESSRATKKYTYVTATPTQSDVGSFPR